MQDKNISNGHIILRYSLALLLWYMSRCSFCTFSFLIVSRSLVLIFSLLFMSLKNNKKIVANSLIFPLKYTTLPDLYPYSHAFSVIQWMKYPRLYQRSSLPLRPGSHLLGHLKDCSCNYSLSFFHD